MQCLTKFLVAILVDKWVARNKYNVQLENNFVAILVDKWVASLMEWAEAVQMTVAILVDKWVASKDRCTL